MDSIDELMKLSEVVFKLACGLGVMYAKGIRDRFKELSSSTEKISDTITEMDKSVTQLNTNVAIMFEKHSTKDRQIHDISKDVRMNRERLHDLTNNHVTKIELNAQRIEIIEEKIA